jgi:hypothetical protein
MSVPQAGRRVRIAMTTSYAHGDEAETVAVDVTLIDRMLLLSPTERLQLVAGYREGSGCAQDGSTFTGDRWSFRPSSLDCRPYRLSFLMSWVAFRFVSFHAPNTSRP